ncbi:MAG: hypothetical protein R3E02_03110 [Blastomonas sp.]
MSRSDQTLADARNTLNRVRSDHSIGMKSRALKRGHFWKKVGYMAIAAGTVIVGAGIVGAIIDGIGFGGVMLTGLTIAGSVAFFYRYPRMEMPTPEKLRQGDLKTLAGKTEIWLESQRLALPPPAITLIDSIGVQLDALAPQLQTLDEKSDAAREVRKLVGEHLPELVTGYRRIPETMRKEARGGRTPEEQLVHGLGVIEREIASTTRAIAEGEVDKLAIQGRFLELKYDGVADS